MERLYPATRHLLTHPLARATMMLVVPRVSASLTAKIPRFPRAAHRGVETALAWTAEELEQHFATALADLKEGE
jgi:hypothetical protein